jgi:uncharacterized beta-barrel protein YwiB (DUF1934 family)
MTEKVILSVSGFGDMVGEDRGAELITAARFYHRNRKHFVLYEDSDSGVDTGGMIKIGDGRVDVIRKGEDHVHMVFEEGSGSTTVYHTTAGELTMELFTQSIYTREREDEIITRISYGLTLNGSFVADYKVQIRVQSQEKAELNMLDNGSDLQ